MPTSLPTSSAPCPSSQSLSHLPCGRAAQQNGPGRLRGGCCEASNDNPPERTQGRHPDLHDRPRRDRGCLLRTCGKLTTSARDYLSEATHARRQILSRSPTSGLFESFWRFWHSVIVAPLLRTLLASSEVPICWRSFTSMVPAVSTAELDSRDKALTLPETAMPCAVQDHLKMLRWFQSQKLFAGRRSGWKLWERTYQSF